MNCQMFSTGFNSGGGSWRQGQKRDVGRDFEFGGGVPSGPVEDKHGVGARRYL